jgi:hypothetical protein
MIRYSSAPNHKNYLQGQDVSLSGIGDMGEALMARDNISGVTSSGKILYLFLIPGKVIQWIMYMGIGSVKGYARVRQQTRLARSPFMTYVYSICGWIGIIYGCLYVSGSLPPGM